MAGTSVSKDESLTANAGEELTYSQQHHGCTDSRYQVFSHTATAIKLVFTFPIKFTN